MGFPQILMIGIACLACGLSLGKHGEPIRSEHNFPLTVFVWAIELGILYWGGFFS